MDIITTPTKHDIKESGNKGWHLYFNEKKTTITNPLKNENGDSTEEQEEVEGYQYYHVYVKQQPTISLYRRTVVATIKEYDESSNVRSFNLSDGTTAYLDKEARTGLDKLCTVKLEQGDTTIELWLHNTKYTVDINSLVAFLKKLEIYASECFNVTQAHIQNLNNTKLWECAEYDFTTGYPEKITFTV